MGTALKRRPFKFLTPGVDLGKTGLTPGVEGFTAISYTDGDGPKGDTLQLT